MSDDDAWPSSEREKASIARETSGMMVEWLCAYLAGSGLLLAWLEPGLPWPVAILVLILVLCLGTIWERKARLRKAMLADVEQRCAAPEPPGRQP